MAEELWEDILKERQTGLNQKKWKNSPDRMRTISRMHAGYKSREVMTIEKNKVKKRLMTEIEETF